MGLDTCTNPPREPKWANLEDQGFRQQHLTARTDLAIAIGEWTNTGSSGSGDLNIVHDFSQLQGVLATGNTVLRELVAAQNATAEAVAAIEPRAAQLNTLMAYMAPTPTPQPDTRAQGDDHLWSFYFVNEGKPHAVEPNTLILPFFPLKVDRTENTLAGAFNEGLSELSEPIFNVEEAQARSQIECDGSTVSTNSKPGSCERNYLTVLSGLLSRTLESQPDAKLALTVQGFASVT